jgi:hypothetical protein
MDYYGQPYTFSKQETFTGTYYDVNVQQATRFSVSQMFDIMANGYSDYLDINENKWYIIPYDFIIFHQYWETIITGGIQFELYEKKGIDFYGRLQSRGSFFNQVNPSVSTALAWRRNTTNDFILRVYKVGGGSANFNIKFIPAYNYNILYKNDSLSAGCKCDSSVSPSGPFDFFNGFQYEVCQKTLTNEVTAFYSSNIGDPSVSIDKANNLLTTDRFRYEPLKNGYYALGRSWSDIYTPTTLAITGSNCTKIINNQWYFNSPCDDGIVDVVINNPCPPALSLKYHPNSIGGACYGANYRTLYYNAWLNIGTILYRDIYFKSPALSGYYSTWNYSTVFFIAGNDGKITDFRSCPDDFSGGGYNYFYMMSSSSLNYLCGSDWLSGYRPTVTQEEYDAWVSGEGPDPYQPYNIKIWSDQQPYTGTGFDNLLNIGSHLWLDQNATIPVPDGRYRSSLTDIFNYNLGVLPFYEKEMVDFQTTIQWAEYSPVFNVSNGIITSFIYCPISWPFFKGSSIKDVCSGFNAEKNELRNLGKNKIYSVVDSFVGVNPVKKNWKDSSDGVYLWWSALENYPYPHTEYNWNYTVPYPWDIGVSLYYNVSSEPVEDCWITPFFDIKVGLYDKVKDPRTGYRLQSDELRSSGRVLANTPDELHRKTRIQNGKVAQNVFYECSTGYVAASSNNFPNEPFNYNYRFPLFPVRSIDMTSLSSPIKQPPLSGEMQFDLINIAPDYSGYKWNMRIRDPYIKLSINDYLYLDVFDLIPAPAGSYIFNLVYKEKLLGMGNPIGDTYIPIFTITPPEISPRYQYSIYREDQEIWQIATVKGSSGKVDSVVTITSPPIPVDGGGGVIGGGGGFIGGGSGSQNEIIDILIKPYKTLYNIYYSTEFEKICLIRWDPSGIEEVEGVILYGDAYFEKSISVGTILFSNDELSVPVPDGYYKNSYSDVTYKVSGNNGEITSIEQCPDVHILFYGENKQDACTNLAPTIIISTGDLKIGVFLYTDVNFNSSNFAPDGYYLDLKRGYLYEVSGGKIISQELNGCPTEIFAYYGLSKFTASKIYGEIVPIYTRFVFGVGTSAYSDFDLKIPIKNGYYRISDEFIIFVFDGEIIEQIKTYKSVVLFPGDTALNACSNFNNRQNFYYSDKLIFGEQLYTDKYLENLAKDGFYKINDSQIYQLIDGKIEKLIVCNNFVELSFSQDIMETCRNENTLVAYYPSILSGILNKENMLFSDYELTTPLEKDGFYRRLDGGVVYEVKNGKIINWFSDRPCPKSTILYYGSYEIGACISTYDVEVFYQKGLDYVNVISIGTEYVDVAPEGKSGLDVDYEENEDRVTEAIYNFSIPNVNREASERTFVINKNETIIDTNIDTAVIDGLYYDVNLTKPVAAGYYKSDNGTVYHVGGFGIIYKVSFCPSAFTTTKRPTFTVQTATKTPWCNHTTAKIPMIENTPIEFTTKKAVVFPRTNISIDPSYPLSDNISQPEVTTTVEVTTTSTTTIIPTTISKIDNTCETKCNALKY